MSETESIQRILVTGPAGKVGQHFITRLLDDPDFDDFVVRALCHNRTVAESPRLEIVRGSISERDCVHEALQGVTHVLHLATCKESPELVMDVTVKGLFWLLEECRQSDTFEQFILIGGDAGMGHFVYPHRDPVTEVQGHSAYPGCYALSKVLEEVMLEQYYIQYDFPGCCLRAPWIIEKDDFKYQLSFGKDVFGGPVWRELVGDQAADEYEAAGTIPIMIGEDGAPVQRNFVHVDDLVDAILTAIDHPGSYQETFNICMDEPVDYMEMAAYLQAAQDLPSVEVQTEFYSTWLDNTKAKFVLGWRPKYDMMQMVDEAFGYQRSDDDPRKIWYPG